MSNLSSVNTQVAVSFGSFFGSIKSFIMINSFGIAELIKY